MEEKKRAQVGPRVSFKRLTRLGRAPTISEGGGWRRFCSQRGEKEVNQFHGSVHRRNRKRVTKKGSSPLRKRTAFPLKERRPGTTFKCTEKTYARREQEGQLSHRREGGWNL